jgi:glycosyltransferase involved in cell wall biosynthesis
MGDEYDGEESNKVRVLYVIGKVAPTSVPLEVAHFIRQGDIRFRVAAYYQTNYTGEALTAPLTRIGAQSQGDWWGVWRLYHSVKEYAPDAVHVHHTVSAFWASLFGKLTGAKVVRTEHGNAEFRAAGQRVINAVSQALSDLVICNSRNTYRSMSSWQKRLLGDRWRVVYNGVDMERIEEFASTPPPFEIAKENVVTIGSVGRFIDQKNYRQLIDAFAQVVSRFPKPIRLVLVGDGENRRTIEQQIDDLELTQQVVLAGEVSKDEVYAALHSFDIFVVPSLGEGFCNAAVEAMAAGLPIVCSDIPTLREVVGDVALYADPKDSTRIANVLLGLLRQGEEEWRKKGNKAHRRATERYSVARTAEQYRQSYRQVAAK